MKDLGFFVTKKRKKSICGSIKEFMKKKNLKIEISRQVVKTVIIQNHEMKNRKNVQNIGSALAIWNVQKSRLAKTQFFKSPKIVDIS